jgi:MerR family redox-sensitive transcriptional activator SoxR
MRNPPTTFPTRSPTRRDGARLSYRWTACIAELERLKREHIGCGYLSPERCRLANPEDRAAGLGAGPRYCARPAARLTTLLVR